MKHKARIIEVGGGPPQSNSNYFVTIEVETLSDLQAIASHLYLDAIIQTGPATDEALNEEPLDRLDELLGRLLLPGGKAEHVSASEIHELVDEVNKLRARKKIGGSNVCETCDAHAQVIEGVRKTVATVSSIIEQHQTSRLAEGIGKSPSLEGCLDRLNGLL